MYQPENYCGFAMQSQKFGPLSSYLILSRPQPGNAQTPGLRFHRLETGYAYLAAFQYGPAR